MNLFRKYNRTLTQFSKFDSKSIMLYPIPNDLTEGEYEVGWNARPSPVDKQFIRALYPFGDKPIAGLEVDGPGIKASIGKPR